MTLRRYLSAIVHDSDETRTGADYIGLMIVATTGKIGSFGVSSGEEVTGGKSDVAM